MVQTKEELAKTRKEYYEKNKEKIKQQHKEYRKTHISKMSVKISGWKHSGLICENRDEYEYIYDRLLNSERCEEPKCNKEYTKDNWKCMDHCHLTGLFRNILCHSCNSKRTLKENSSGIPNIYKRKNGWTYIIMINKKTHSKFSKDLEFLKNYKIEYENKYIYNI